MPSTSRIALIAGAGLGGLALLLLIISVATPAWVDDGAGNTVGLFRVCYADNSTTANSNPAKIGCQNANRVTQGGLAIFGLLLLIFAIVAVIAGAFIQKIVILFLSLGLMYFSSMFIMGAYATWGTYSRDPLVYFFPLSQDTITYNATYTSMGYSYHLCVAAHYFLWTALTIIAFGIGMNFSEARDAAPH